MNGWFSALHWLRLWLLLGLAASLWTGCATSKIDWNRRVGVLTYDQAILELGPPDKSAKLNDGTMVADWLTGRGHSYAYAPFAYSYSPYGPGYPAYVDSYNTPDYYLRLTFGPDGRLAQWKKVYK